MVAMKSVLNISTSQIQAVLEKENVPVAQRTIRKIIQQEKETGSPDKKPRGGNHSQVPLSEEEKEIICDYQRDQNESTLS